MPLATDGSLRTLCSDSLCQGASRSEEAESQLETWVQNALPGASIQVSRGEEAALQPSRTHSRLVT